MANYITIAQAQIQYLANAMFTKLKSWCTGKFIGKGELTKSDVTTALGYTPPTTNTTYSVATTTANGLMSTTDKTKLNGIDTEANKTTVDTAMSATSTNPVQNKVAKEYVDGKITSTLKDVAFVIDEDTGILYYKKTMNS